MKTDVHNGDGHAESRKNTGRTTLPRPRKPFPAATSAQADGQRPRGSRRSEGADANPKALPDAALPDRSSTLGDGAEKKNKRSLRSTGSRWSC